MEISFILNATRRFFWVVALLGITGAIVGAALAGGDDTTHRSAGVLLVSPPVDERAPGAFTGDPDRYIQGQVAVLRSHEVAERVAERVGDGLDVGEVLAARRIESDALSDAVNVTVSNSDGAVASQIVNGYLEVYLDMAEAAAEGIRKDEVEALSAQIASTRLQLTEVDDQLDALMAPYLDRDTIPAPEQVAPGLASEQRVLIDRLGALEASKLDRSAGVRVTSSIAEAATPATEAASSPTSLAAGAGLLGGAFAGVLAALMLASTSRSVGSDAQAEEILGVPVVGSFPVLRGVLHDRVALFDALEPSAVDVVSALTVQAESTAFVGEVGTVMVTGTREGAGTTTVAASLARGFADTGARVRLVDADPTHAELAGLSDDLDADPGREGALSGVALSSLGSVVRPEDGATDLRPAVRSLVRAFSASADVIVIDGGSLSGSTTTARLALQSDAVVLVMPQQESVRRLDSARRRLSDASSLLPVWAPVRAGNRDALRTPR